jgi:hypothetical protein
MSGAFDDWEKDAQGRLKVWPLAAFSTALFANERGGLRLEIDAPPREGESTPALQLALDATQLRGLSDALAEVAERLETARATTDHA